tara:strand:+ start:155 stop:361 length:207 start_codon:yes stop_codon:yes gene_type:complete
MLSDRVVLSLAEEGLLTVREYYLEEGVPYDPPLVSIIVSGEQLASFNSPVSAMAWLIYSIDRISDEIN